MKVSIPDESYSRSTRMHILSYTFVYASIVLFSSRCDSLKTSSCKLVGSCSCMFENEEGYDLSVLNKFDDRLNATKDNLTFYFHPCTNISIGNNKDLNSCYEGVSVCLFNHTSQKYTNLGYSNEVGISSIDPINSVVFKYLHNESITTLHLQCDPISDQSFLEVKSVSSKKYDLLLSSPSACRGRVSLDADPPEDPPHHLSTGSVLVIMLVVFSSVYFVGGALVLKLLRGAEGREMIPNYDFWVSLPGLVKEGFLFTLSGCSTPQAYDRI